MYLCVLDYIIEFHFFVYFLIMIFVKHLLKSYGNTKALKGIDFEIKKGQIVGFLRT